jgi:hypothetical protein
MNFTLTHVRNIGHTIRHATLFNFLSPIRDTLICVVAEPSIHPMQEPVDPVVSKPLVNNPIVVHLEHGLEETAAEGPEVRILAQFPLLDLAAARGRERRAIGSALRFVEG